MLLMKRMVMRMVVGKKKLQLFAWVGYVFRNLDSTKDTIEAPTAYPCASLQNNNNNLVSRASSSLLDNTRHLEQQYDEQKPCSRRLRRKLHFLDLRLCG